MKIRRTNRLKIKFKCKAKETEHYWHWGVIFCQQYHDMFRKTECEYDAYIALLKPGWPSSQLAHSPQSRGPSGWRPGCRPHEVTTLVCISISSYTSSIQLTSSPSLPHLLTSTWKAQLNFWSLFNYFTGHESSMRFWSLPFFWITKFMNKRGEKNPIFSYQCKL